PVSIQGTLPADILEQIRAKQGATSAVANLVEQVHLRGTLPQLTLPGVGALASWENPAFELRGGRNAANKAELYVGFSGQLKLTEPVKKRVFKAD
ncbi:hypothetical protein, partial [Magnetococcus sp. PR-3]